MDLPPLTAPHSHETNQAKRSHNDEDNDMRSGRGLRASRAAHAERTRQRSLTSCEGDQEEDRTLNGGEVPGIQSPRQMASRVYSALGRFAGFLRRLLAVRPIGGRK